VGATGNKEEREGKFGQGERVEGWGHKWIMKGPGEAAGGVYHTVNIGSSTTALYDIFLRKGVDPSDALVLEEPNPMLRCCNQTHDNPHKHKHKHKNPKTKPHTKTEQHTAFSRH
jgi:hypothetical protein